MRLSFWGSGKRLKPKPRTSKFGIGPDYRKEVWPVPRKGGPISDSRSIRPLFGLVLKFLLLALCLGWLAKIIIELGPGSVFRAAGEAEPVWLVLALIPLWFRFAVWAWKWRLLTDYGPDVGFIYLFRLVMSGCLVNLATPTAKLGGGVFRAWMLHRKKGLRRAHAFGWVLADQFSTAIGTLFLFGCLAFGTMVWFPEKETRLTSFGVGLLFFAVVALWLWGRTRLWKKARDRDPSPFLRKWIPGFLKRYPVPPDKEWVATLLQPALAPKPVLWSFAIEIVLPMLSFLCLCWSNALVLKALGTDLSILQMFVAVSLGYALGSMLGIMGGIGVTEVFLIQIFTRFGMTPELAASGALIHRAIYYGFVLISGGWASWTFKRTASIKAPNRRQNSETHREA